MTRPGPGVTAPSLGLPAIDAVVAQLTALKAEPYDGRGAGPGIDVAWAFASPGNRAATGPLPRFARLLREPTYRGLLGHRAATLSPMAERADDAQVEVLVVTADDETVGFTWLLGRQRVGPLAGCWLTDGVLRHPDRVPRER